MEKNKIQKSEPASRNPKISPPRVAAFEILSRIETEKAFSSALLPFYEEKLEPNDRGLCHEITLGVLRKQLYLDRLIDKLTNGRKIDSAVRVILRIALYQLNSLDKIPPHAAINDAVNLTQKAKKTSAKGFVNAILRRFTREKIELEYADEIEKISVENSHPRWLIEKWIAGFGIEETVRLAEANNQTPRLSFRATAKTTEAVKKTLATADGADDKSFLLELAAHGKIYFQDEGSQIVGGAVGLKSGESFLDLCAAPGSKTTQIASDFDKSNHHLFAAGDLHWSRVKILRENCRKQGVDWVAALQYDAEKTLPFADQSFDVVLLDAPCSGTGTIRHNPEIRYLLEEKDFGDLQAKQLAVLNNASKLIKLGGRLIYSTCSLEREENEAVCQKFSAAQADFQIRAPQVDAKFLTREGFARTFPQRDAMDGFFVAVFEKI